MQITVYEYKIEIDGNKAIVTQPEFGNDDAVIALHVDQIEMFIKHLTEAKTAIEAKRPVNVKKND